MGRDAGRRPIFTIGHSTRSLEQMLALLEDHGIRTLVDIRSIRRSRTNPQFNEDTFGRALARAGIRYVPMPLLGGRRGKAKREEPSRNDAWQVAAFRNYADYAETPPFLEGLAQLIRIAGRGPTVIMCAEAVWWRCHRRIVADHLLARRVPVVHLLAAREDEATLTPFAVPGPGGTVRYPAGPRTRVGSQPKRKGARR